jgi:uncharacterized Rmd1/YagE family protein
MGIFNSKNTELNAPEIKCSKESSDGILCINSTSHFDNIIQVCISESENNKIKVSLVENKIKPTTTETEKIPNKIFCNKHYDE